MISEMGINIIEDEEIEAEDKPKRPLSAEEDDDEGPE